MSTRAGSHSKRGHGLKLAACAVGLLTLGAAEPPREGVERSPARTGGGSLRGTPIAGVLACPDTDTDGFADCTVAGCDDTGLTCGDCDDTSAGVNPGAAEVCNHTDDDCDGLADEGFSQPETYASVQDTVDGRPRDESGWSVAGIGDATGDGADDFVVGVHLDDLGNRADAGSVLLYSGASRSVVCRAVAPSPSDGDELGHSVSAVPDMNMDGRPDFLAGVPLDDDTAGDGGSVFLFSGADCSVIRQYRDPNGRSGDQLGFSVGWVADLTMDGVPEILAGAPLDDTVVADAGSVTVFDGTTGAVRFRLTDPDGQASVLGSSVVGLGDVDFDDVPDIAGAGSPVLVYSGVDGSLIYKTEFGGSPLAVLDDIDGDGVKDFAVGRPKDNTQASSSGAVMLFSGVNGSVIDRLTHPAAAPGDELGHSLAAIPDITGDGLGEIVAGAWHLGVENPGGAFIFDPSTGTIVGAALVDPAGAREDRLGQSVSWADMTGDGDPEILIGAHQANSAEEGNVGKVVIVSFESDCDGDGVSPFGADCDDTDAANHPGNTEICDAQDNDCDARVDDDDDGDGFGVCDGDCDLSNPLIFPGAVERCNGLDDDCDAEADDGTDNDLDGVEAPCDCDDGNAAIFPGATEVCSRRDDDCDGLIDEGFTGPTVQIKLTDPEGAASDRMGTSAAGIGDANGDGVDDFVVGVPGDDHDNRVDPGSVLLYSGFDRSVLCRAIALMPENGDTLGYSVSAVPDMNMDGRRDFLAGSPLDDAAGAGDAGVVVLFSGADCSVIRQYRDPNGQRGDQLGISVGWVDDQTMDGVPEILAGAPENDTPQGADAGSVTVFNGATGAVRFRLRTPNGRASDRLGNAVVGLGDVNFDGVPDIAAGAYLDDILADADVGSVQVYSGADGSLIYKASYNPTRSLEHLGFALAALDDVDEDGVKDIAAGQPNEDTEATDAGMVVLISGRDGSVIDRLTDPFGATDDELGHSLAAIPDLTGDGLREIVAGKWLRDVSASSGSAVILDPSTGAIVGPELSDATGAANDGFSISVAAAGDIRGGGRPEILVGAYLDDDALAGNDAGSVVLYSFDEYDCDADGVTPLGGDCDDTDAAVNPGAAELCDLVDNDCDGSTDEGSDADGDGFALCGGDCDDTEPLANPNQPEVCDGFDNNCDGTIDEDVDDDGDGFTSCGGDCDDNDAATNPGAPEVCDLVDNNCDTAVDEGFDADADAYTTCGGDCDDANNAVNPGASEFCNLEDDNCDGAVDEGLDSDGDGFTSCGGDCDDNDGNRYPGAAEVCDTIDNDCDGSVPPSEADADGDGYPLCAQDCDDSDGASFPGGVESCDGADNDCSGAVPSDEADADADGFRICDGDCVDGDGAVYPGAAEICDTIDNDCNFAVDDGFDADVDGYTSCGGDCDDGNINVNPGAEETCNGVDDNCDDATDEGFNNDGDGYTTCGGDCDDDNGNRFPGAAEVCDGVDDDCDGVLPVNEADMDGDGFPICLGDCDDSDGGSFPGGVEACDGADNDCSGAVGADEADGDADGFRVCDGDCDDGDGSVNFDAPEICNDGIDNDCDTEIDVADSDCSTEAVTICSTLGDAAADIDQDIWTFTGAQGERVTVDLAVSGGGAGAANLHLAHDDGAGLFLVDRGELPSRIVATLPAAGTYRVMVVQQPKLAFVPGAKFVGGYCLTVEGDQGAAGTLIPTASVESILPAAAPPPNPGGGSAPRERTPFDRPFDSD